MAKEKTSRGSPLDMLTLTARHRLARDFLLYTKKRVTNKLQLASSFKNKNTIMRIHGNLFEMERKLMGPKLHSPLIHCRIIRRGFWLNFLLWKGLFIIADHFATCAGGLKASESGKLTKKVVFLECFLVGNCRFFFINHI